MRLCKNGNVVNEQGVIANIFLDTFLQKSTGTAAQTSAHLSRFHNETGNFVFDPTTPSEIKKIIKSLKDTNALGPYEVPVSLVKECVEELCAPLCAIVNSSFIEGIYPDIFKLGKIIPLFKKGDRTDPANYRPITLLSVFAKIHEKAIAIRLLEHLVKHELITKHQYAYQSGKSVQQAIFELVSAVFDSLENHELTIGLFHDMSKAYDNVYHEGLFNKLEAKGFRGTALALLKSYNVDRLLYVCIREYRTNESPRSHFSNTIKWNQGVPQGSLLGPYMFLVVMDDLPTFVQQQLGTIFEKDSVMSLYADDINHTMCHKELDVLSDK